MYVAIFLIHRNNMYVIMKLFYYYFIIILISPRKMQRSHAKSWKRSRMAKVPKGVGVRL